MRCLGCRPPASYRLEKPTYEPTLTCHLTSLVVERQHRPAGSISGWQLARPAVCRLRSSYLRVCVDCLDQDRRPCPRLKELEATQDVFCRVVPQNPDYRVLTPCGLRFGLNSDHPVDASSPFFRRIARQRVASTSIRLGHAAEHHLAVAFNLVIRTQQTDFCFPSPQTTSTRAS